LFLLESGIQFLNSSEIKFSSWRNYYWTISFTKSSSFYLHLP